MKFLHTADWQIGMRAAHVGAVGPKVREARLEAARRVVEVAHREQVEFIVVAGDTFEDNAVDRVLVQRVADILGKFTRGPVFLIPGNHDPLVPGSVWEHPAWGACARLHVLREATPVAVPGGTLHPAPLLEKHSPADPTAALDARGDTGIAIGLAHGTVQGIAQGEPDYPIARNAAERAGLDYLALGHWHSFATYDGGAGVRMAYSGTHETTKFGERDSGNVLVVEVLNRGAPPKLTPHRTGGLLWRQIDRDIGQAGDLRSVREEIEAIRDGDTTLLDVRLSGVLACGEEEEIRRIADLIGARFLFGRCDTTALRPAPTDAGWLAELPAGFVRDAAEELQRFSDPGFPGPRPEEAAPQVAARALLTLYAMSREARA